MYIEYVDILNFVQVYASLIQIVILNVLNFIVIIL